MVVSKPVPVSNALDQGFWDAAAEGRLEIQRCCSCRRYFHPATAMCFSCGSEELRYEPVSGRGTVYTYTVTYDARTPAFSALQPYPVGWIELDEQPRLRLLSNLPSTRIEDIRIGARVEVYFEAITDHVSLPQFRVISEVNND